MWLYQKLKEQSLEIFRRKLRVEVAALPNTGPIDSLTAQVVTSTLLEQRKQTVAVLEISSSVSERIEVVQVLYP